MTNLSRKIRQAMSLPPHTAFRKAVEIVLRSLRKRKERKRDMFSSTYLNTISTGSLFQYIYAAPLPQNSENREIIRRIANLALEHRFDILGAGAVSVDYKTNCAETEGNRYDSKVSLPRINNTNQEESARIASLLPAEYRRIDWQRDVKSGWRWSELVWHKDIRYGDVAGADVKTPWELARMQHLLAMAQSAAMAQAEKGHVSDAMRYADEFSAQIADFIAANPPRFGVNWVTSMDVGIRVANWLIAYDIFRSLGFSFSEEWEYVFRRSIWEHGAHIASNLEWSSTLRGNHYLADIAGLLFCAAWLPRTQEADVWLAFAVQEFIVEIELQFLSDGGNFEASLPYHRLSAEMAVYGAALIQGLPDEKLAALREYDYRLWKNKPPLKPAKNTEFSFPSDFLKKLHNICRFTEKISEIGTIPQIGDNDSGRFLIATPIAKILSRAQGLKIYFNLASVQDLPEEILVPTTNIHTPLLASAAALNGFEHYYPFARQYTADYELAASLSCRRKDAHEHSELFQEQAVVANHKFLENPAVHSFDNFGLTIIRIGNFAFAIRSGSIGQRGKGGHAHNDQLSLTLSYKGKEFFVDAGTYLYTPAPEMRNRFRSTEMHNTLCMKGKEQNDWLQGGGDVLFWMLGDKSRGRAIELSDDKWIGEHYGYGEPHRRIVEWQTHTIKGLDECEELGEQFLMFHLLPDIDVMQSDKNSVILKNDDANLAFYCNGTIHIINSLYSLGYGWLQPTKALRIEGAKKFEWSITEQ